MLTLSVNHKRFYNLDIVVLVRSCITATHANMSYASSDEVKNMAYDQANLREKPRAGESTRLTKM